MIGRELATVRRGRRARLVALGYGLPLLFLAPAAAGQETPDQAKTEASSDGQADGSQDIIVTAQRREERLQDVAIAMTAFSGEKLATLGIQGTKELSLVTPGLNFTQSVYSPQPTIRGIGTRGVGAGEESVVPIYIDGVYQPFIPAADLQFNNIERIEVLKGPQGALLGRNATGGAINIITRRPQATPTADFSLSYGSLNEVIAKGYASAGSDVIAANVAFVVTRNDGYIRDVLSGARYGAKNDVSVRGKLAITPANWLEVTLGVNVTDNVESTGVGYEVLNRNTVALRYNPNVLIPSGRNEAALSFAPFNMTRQIAGSLKVAGTFDGISVISLTGVQRNRFNSRTDGDASPVYIGESLTDLKSDNFYQELYATSTSKGPLSWIVGGVYYHDVASRPQLSYQVSLAGVTSLNNVASTVRTNSFAAYAQATYEIGAGFSVTAGGRYTTERKRILGNLILPTPLTFEKAATFRKFTPAVTLQFRPDRNINIYAKVGQAFKSGLFNSQAANAAAAGPIAPENVTQYEVGAKLTPTSWSSFEISGYVTDYKNLQSNTRDPVTLVSLLQNAGAVKIKGLEAQATVRPLTGLSLFAGLAYMDGKYRDFPAAQVTTPNIIGGRPVGNNTIFIDAAGKTLIRAPSFTFNVGGNLTVPTRLGKIRLSTNLYHAGVSYWDILNRLKQNPYTLLNGELGFTTANDTISISLWGENLLDADYDETVITSASADSRVPARPRTVGVRVGFHF